MTLSPEGLNLSVAGSRTSSHETDQTEDNEDVCIHSVAPVDIWEVDSVDIWEMDPHAASPGTLKEDSEDQGHRVSNPVDPRCNAIADSDLDSPLELGRQRSREEITTNQSDVNCFARIIDKDCMCPKCNATGTKDDVLNSVRQGGQGMSLDLPISRWQKRKNKKSEAN